MTTTFYYLSGSPFAWRVWLALEHKGVPYDLMVVSPDAGDLKTEHFRSINPHGKAPALVHDGFALYESSAIIDYINEAFAGRALWPTDVRDRATARRIAAECEGCLYAPVRRLVGELLSKKETPVDFGAVRDAKAAAADVLKIIANGFVVGPFLADNAPSAADFALYPFVAILRRMDERSPGFDVGEIVPASLNQWRQRIEALPFFEKTIPPHWRAP